jgi:hypothetical protein
MNERIKELAEQAGWDSHHSKFDTRIEKFAELIVRECAKYINERSQDWDADLRWIFNDGSGDMAVNVDELLNRHFGVEE